VVITSDRLFRLKPKPCRILSSSSEGNTPFTNLPPQIVVSWVMVLIRRFDHHEILFLALCPDARFRHFLAKELRSRLTARDRRIEEERKARPESNGRARRRWWRSPVSTLLRRTATLHDESDNETDSIRSSKENQKNRRVRPDMIRRIDDRPMLVNPSGRISEGRMLTVQEGGTPVESGSTRSRSSIRSSVRELQSTNPRLVQSPEPVHSQPSGQQPNGSEVESESELDDINEITHRGRLNRRISDTGALPHRKSVLGGRAFFLLTPSVASSPPNHFLPLYPPQPRSPSVTRTQTVEFAPSPQPRGRHLTKLSVDRSNKRQPSVTESRVQPSFSNGENTHVEVASKSSRALHTERALSFQ
jgi:hypothetical protein